MATQGTSRPVVVAVRLSAQEAAALDRARGGVSRSVWLRWMLRKAVTPAE